MVHTPPIGTPRAKTQLPDMPLTFISVARSHTFPTLNPFPFRVSFPSEKSTFSHVNPYQNDFEQPYFNLTLTLIRTKAVIYLAVPITFVERKFIYLNTNIFHCNHHLFKIYTETFLYRN